MSDQPIFVIGVPRSGTTLLRVMLDSHPNIASGPETPWFCAHHPRTLGSLVDYLIEDQHGYCKNFGGSRAEVFNAARTFVSSLLGAHAARRGKSRWAEKNPANLLFLPFLTELFPHARFIHIRRHPLDVALSTSTVPPHRKGVTPHNERSLTLFYNQSMANNPFSALLRWVHWENLIARGLAGADRLPLQYFNTRNWSANRNASCAGYWSSWASLGRRPLWNSRPSRTSFRHGNGVPPMSFITARPRTA
jgi:hypothetical protein